jgi:hypothetical protein
MINLSDNNVISLFFIKTWWIAENEPYKRF